MHEKKDFKSWIKAHKKELIIAGISITGLLLLIVGIKNKKELEQLFESVRSMIKPTKLENQTSFVEKEVIANVIPIQPYLEKTRAPHHVNGHPMKLAEGKKISDEMAKFVTDNNISLPPNHTYRRSYETGMVV